MLRLLRSYGSLILGRAYTRTASLCVLFKSPVTRIGSACGILSLLVLSKIRFLARFSEIQFCSSDYVPIYRSISLRVIISFYVLSKSRATSAEYPCQNIESRE